MADIALGGVERILKAGFAIKKAVQTARRNKKECRDIERSVARIEALLLLLNQMMAEALKHPAINGPLLDLAESIEEALELIEDCEGRHPVRRLLGAGGMARELRRVHDDIMRKLTLGNFATTVLQVTITWIQTIPYGVPHPPSIQLQDAVEVVNSYSSHLTTDDAISGFNSEITMVTTSSEVPNDPPSRLTEFNLPKLEATMHHVSQESISGEGGHSVVFQRKIVIKIQMSSSKSRSRALSLAAKAVGTSSVGIIGDEQNMMEVIGQGLDIVCLVRCLSRKLASHAEILRVEDVKLDKGAQQQVVLNTEEARPADKTANRQRSSPSGGFQAVLTKLPKFMRPRARRSVSRPPPSPLQVEHTSNPAPHALEGPRSHLFSAPSTSTAVGEASPPAHDELAAVEAGCVLEDYVGMFDGPMPPPVIASLTGALFHVDDEGSTI